MVIHGMYSASFQEGETVVKRIVYRDTVEPVQGDHNGDSLELVSYYRRSLDQVSVKSVRILMGLFHEGCGWQAGVKWKASLNSFDWYQTLRDHKIVTI